MLTAALGAVVGGVVGGVVASNRTGQRTVVETFANGAGTFTKPSDSTVQQVLAKVEPAVVSIHTTGFQAAPTTNPFGFGGFGGGGGTAFEAAGTGMIVSATGDVLTNNHVIAGATKVTVNLFGQSKAYDATVVNTDPTDDVALIHIQGVSGLPTVTFAAANAVQVGDSVLAIGNALDLNAQTPTVTEGIISAEHRTVQTGDANNPNATETLTDILQTDAAINPGNSGGPLVDAQGQVVGMNTAVAGSSGAGGTQAQNIGFAIPVNKFLPILNQLKAGKTFVTSRAFIGVSVETLTADLRQQFGLTPTSGAIVAAVDPGSPAQTAGLQPGDVITALNGSAINSADDLTSAVGKAKPGAGATLTVYRGSQKMSVHVTLGSRSTG
jgi:S1-C subfamily serine protease